MRAIQYKFLATAYRGPKITEIIDKDKEISLVQQSKIANGNKRKWRILFY